jgi:hypothetical protein
VARPSVGAWPLEAVPEELRGPVAGGSKGLPLVWVMAPRGGTEEEMDRAAVLTHAVQSMKPGVGWLAAASHAMHRSPIATQAAMHCSSERPLVAASLDRSKQKRLSCCLAGGWHGRSWQISVKGLWGHRQEQQMRICSCR